MRNILSLFLILSMALSFMACETNGTDSSAVTSNATASKTEKSISSSLGENPRIELSVGETKRIVFKVEAYSSLSESTFKPVVINSDILDIEYDLSGNGYVYYNITAKSAGITEVYVELSGTTVRSEVIRVTVNEKAPDYIVGAVGESGVSVIAGRTTEICFAILGSDFSESDLNIVVDDSKIAKLTYKSTSGIYVYYTLEGLSSGNAEVHLETADGSVKSDTVKVAVIKVADTTGDNSETTSYIANASSKVFHLLTCHNVDRISTENKLYFECDREELLAQDYSPCEVCNP